MPFIIETLGEASYGLWILVGSFIGYYSLMELGLTSAIQRFVSRAIGQRDELTINKVVNTTLSIFLFLGFCVFILTFLLAIFVPRVIKNIDDIRSFRFVILILGWTFAISLPGKVFSGILAANIRFDLTAIIEIIRLSIRTILIIIFLKKGEGIIALTIISAVTELGCSLAKFICVKKLYGYIILSHKFIEIKRIKELFSYSINTFLSTIADQLRFNVDNLVLVNFIGLSSITMFSIGARLIQYFKEFMLSLLGSTIPIFSQYEGQGDYDSIREKFIFLTKISIYFSITIGGLLIVLGKAFILKWVGMGYVQSYTILLILLIPTLFDTILIPGGGLLYGLSKHRYYMFSNIGEGVLNLFLSILLVKNFGIYGVALGTAIPMMITKIFIQPIYTCRIIQLSIKDFYCRHFLPVLGLSSAVLLIFWMIIKNLILRDYLNLLLLSIAGLCLMLATFFLFGFSKDEKGYLIELASKVYKK